MMILWPTSSSTDSTTVWQLHSSWASSSVPSLPLREESSAGRMTPRWRVRASPATEERKARTAVLTGGAVSWRGQAESLRDMANDGTGGLGLLETHLGDQVGQH